MTSISFVTSTNEVLIYIPTTSTSVFPTGGVDLHPTPYGPSTYMFKGQSCVLLGPV